MTSPFPGTTSTEPQKFRSALKSNDQKQIFAVPKPIAEKSNSLDKSPTSSKENDPNYRPKTHSSENYLPKKPIVNYKLSPNSIRHDSQKSMSQIESNNHNLNKKPSLPLKPTSSSNHSNNNNKSNKKLNSSLLSNLSVPTKNHGQL